MINGAIGVETETASKIVSMAEVSDPEIHLKIIKVTVTKAKNIRRRRQSLHSRN